MMTDVVANLILEQLRSLRDRQERSERELREVHSRLNSLVAAVGATLGNTVMSA